MTLTVYRLFLIVVLVFIPVGLYISDAVEMDAILLFVGDSYERVFTEDETQLYPEVDQNTLSAIQVKMDGIPLTTVSSDGFYITRSRLKVLLKNDNVRLSIPEAFNITINYATKGHELIHFRRAQGKSTKDFVLPQEAQKFQLDCQFEAGNNAVSFEWVYNLGDAKKPDWKVVQDQSNEQLSVKTHRNGKTVSVVFTNTEFKHVLHRLLDPLVAYAGVYACKVQFPDNVIGYRQTTVSAKPTTFMEPMREQYMSGTSLIMECKAYAWPLPMVTWFFAPRQMYTEENKLQFVKFSSESNSLGVEIEATEQIHLKQNTRVVISRLKLHNIHPRSHRASYRCVASNSYNSTSSEYYLRVRDRTAWVIPLIGILIQISVIALSVSFCKLSKRGEITMTARSGQDETDEKLMTTASQISTMESRSPPK